MGKITDSISKLHPLALMLRGTFISVALLLLGFAAWHASESIRTIATHEKAVAEVIRCNADGSPNSRLKTYSLQVRFQISEGQQTASVNNSQTSYEPGEQMDIYYVPETAYRAKPGGFWGLWSLPGFLTVIGGMFLFYGAWPIKDKKR